MDRVAEKLTPEQEEMWEQLKREAGLDKLEAELKTQKNRKPIQEWSREEMETYLRETQVAVVSEDGEVLNKMKDAPKGMYSDYQASMDLIDRVGKERLRKFKELQKRSPHTLEEKVAQIHFFDNPENKK